MKDQILNCIIPDHWVEKAIAAKLSGDEVGLRGRREILITMKGGQECWPIGKLKRAMYSSIGSRALVWIRLEGTGKASDCQLSMEQTMRRHQIQFARAMAWVKNDKPGSRRRKVHFGVVVEMRDSCRAILLFRPNLVEERRALRYNRDDPEY